MIVSDLYQGIQDNLMGRVVANAKMAATIRKCALEFSENYKFPGLQAPGPVVALIPNQPNYNTSFFTLLADGSINLNKVDSFFVFTDPFVLPSSAAYTGDNAGYNLTYKTIQNLEVLLNTSGVPLHWTRYNGQVWIACNPDQTYNVYMRYQHEHPFSNPVADSDPLFFPNSWQDVLEYASTQRLAKTYNLSSKADEMNEILNGSKKWQETGGLEGQPGLVFQRTSQEQRDQSTSVKRLRIKMGRV
jgi:hypothetical protein